MLVVIQNIVMTSIVFKSPSIAYFRRHLYAKNFSKIGKDTSNDYCVDLVKKHDYHNYLIGLLFPSQVRGAYFTLRAYNVELALVKENALGNPLSARIRLQWWRDTVASIFKSNEILKHPVAQPLKVCVVRYNLSRMWLERLIDSRMSDLIKTQPEALSDLEDYGEKSNSSMLYLILEVSSVTFIDQNVLFLFDY